MLDTDTIATSLFEKIRAQFEKVSVGDEKAKATNRGEFILGMEHGNSMKGKEGEMKLIEAYRWSDLS